MTLRFPLLALLLVACDPTAPDSEVVTTTLTDEGTACLNDAGEVEVTFPYCLSSSCDTLMSATCSAELVDGVLEVHGEAVIETVGVTCTADCGIVMATCAAPLIEDPDTVTMSYAGESHPLGEACAGI